MGFRLIEARNVIKKYGAVTALDDFTVDIPEGKIGILGPNGAGKSTFVKIALGLIGASNGEITVLGEKLTKNSVDIRRRIGTAVRNSSLRLHLPVGTIGLGM